MVPTWERFEVLVDGRVESNNPALAECLREWPLMEAEEKEAAEGDVKLVALVGGFSESGDMPFLSLALPGSRSLGECALATDLAAVWAVDRVGREKFCCWTLLELLLGREVKLAYIGVAVEVTSVGLFRALTTFNGVVSSLEEDSTRRGGGGLGEDVDDGLLVLEVLNGEKLPGALGATLAGAGCIFAGPVAVTVEVKGLSHLGPKATLACDDGSGALLRWYRVQGKASPIFVKEAVSQTVEDRRDRLKLYRSNVGNRKRFPTSDEVQWKLEIHPRRQGVHSTSLGLKEGRCLEQGCSPAAACRLTL